jgi:hypothetical protein
MARAPRVVDDKQKAAKKDIRYKLDSTVSRGNMSDNTTSKAVSPNRDKRPTIDVSSELPIVSPPKAPPILSLASFGIQPDETTVGELPQKVVSVSKSHLLKCAVLVDKGMLRRIVFRCEPKESWKTCWHEKLLFDAIREESSWTTALGLTYTVPWAINNVIQTNGRDFPVRVFCIDSQPIQFNEENIIAIGKHICENLNLMNKFQFPIIAVEETNFFWLPTDACVVMANVTTNKEIFRLIEKKCGKKGDRSDYYSAHSDTIHTYFRRNDLTPEIADAVGAPSSQIHPDLQFEILKVDSDEETEFK